MTVLNVLAVAQGVTDTLGPGRRSVVWVQGCSLHCPGCIVPESWGFGRGRWVDPDALAVELLGGDPDAGLTVTGGEPTDQPEGVVALLGAARRLGRTTWVYTGRTLEELRSHPQPVIAKLLGRTDVLVDGRYDLARAAALGYRGSSNQRILRLTGAIAREDAEGGQPGRVQVQVDESGKLTVIGVPAPGFLGRFHEQLGLRGLAVDPEHRW